MTNGSGDAAVAGEPTRWALLEAVRACSMPMILSDPRLPDNPIVFANEAFAELSGYPVDQITGRNCRFLQGPDTDPAAVAILREAIAARRPASVELVNHHKDGRRFVNELRISPIFDEHGTLVHFFGCQNDVTAFTNARHDLADSDARYRTLFDAIDEGFCIIEIIDGPHGPLSDYVHVETNAAFSGNAGLTDAIGRSARELLGEEADGWVALYRQVLLSGDPSRFERELTTTDRHLELYAFPAGPSEERRVGVLFKDVSDRVRAERSLRELTSTLERRVEEGARELVASRDELRQAQKMEAIGKLTGGIAHDFNNLLTVIRSAAELLTKEELAPAKRAKYAQAVLETADRAAKLTGQLLAFARRQPLRPETFDVAERVGGMADLLRGIVGPGVSVSIGASKEPIHVTSDATQLEAALVNLAANARDAMDGTGSLVMAVQRLERVPAIRQHAEVDGSFVEIALTDDGPGIPAEIRDRIFEPFFTTKDIGKGTGLGLSQVYGFVKQSGGQIDVDSSPTGTTFRIYLPMSGADDSNPPYDRQSVLQSEADVTARSAGLRVLAVEDDQALAPFAIELLRELGHAPTLVMSAGAALAAMHRDPKAYDLLFTDVMMPGMTGVDLARETRSRQPDLPVLLTSGYSDALAAGEAEGFPLLPKPYSAASLGRAITLAVGRFVPKT